MAAGGGLDIYVVDTSAIIDLELLGGTTSYCRDTDHRLAVFANLTAFVAAGRAITVAAAGAEIKRKSPSAYQRLRAVWGEFVVRDTPAILIGGVSIAAQFPTLVHNLALLPAAENPADPFLIALAMQRSGHILVTSEKPRESRSPRRRRRDRIPEVCAQLGVPCISLAAFMAAEGLG